MSVPWSEYARCHRCFAHAGLPCWSLRTVRGRRELLKWPHRGRRREVSSEKS